jgi:hypothetical protein
MLTGMYRAIVKETNDPEKRGRIKVECPAVLGRQLSNWALPCLPPNTFSVPILNTMVWITFEGGRKDSPIWMGVFYTTDQRKLLFQDVYNPKDFIISTQDGWVNIYSKRGILNKSGTDFLVRSTGTARINETSDTGSTKIGTVDALKYTENGTKVALVGYPTSDGSFIIQR